MLSAADAAQTETSAFVERLGVDTVAIERYRRTSTGFEGARVVRSPLTRVARYSAELDDEGQIVRFEVEWRTPADNPEGPETQSFTIRLVGDSAIIHRSGGRAPGTETVSVPDGVIPVLGTTPWSMAVLEQAIRQAMRIGGDSVPVHFLAPNGRVSNNAVIRTASDSVRLSFFGRPMLAELGEDGTLLGRSGRRTTLKVETRRVDGLDLEGLAADFAARDARGEGLGVPSPQETVVADVEGSRIEIVYSRPAKRGRVIWGGVLVPWGEVWRTGANAATQFDTSRDLEIGGTAVPAGTYTLYSVFTPESGQLIINTQTGQWGTTYNADLDLARIPLELETLDEPVERFTISIQEDDDGTRLQLAWGTRRYSASLDLAGAPAGSP